MPLDPDLAKMLALLESFNAPTLASGTPEQARKAFRTLTVDLRDPATVVPVAAVEDLRIDGGAGPIPARIYRPDTERTAVPTVVFVHGGGFVIGDLDCYDNQARWLCREVEAVVLSVDYRLAPENPWPAGFSDCLAATRWAAAHIEELGGDLDRLGVAGDSAGGNLSAAVAQACRDAGAPELAAQLLIYPSTDFNDDDILYPSRVANAEGYYLTRETMHWFHTHYVGSEPDWKDPRISPLHGNLADLPPAVVVTAEYDPLRDEGDAYAAALAEAEVEVRHRQFPGLIHGFFGLPGLSEASADAVRWTCAAFRELLER